MASLKRGRGGKRTVRLSNLPALPEEEKLDRIATALADPLDARSDEELCALYEYDSNRLKKLKKDPHFYEPILQNFRRNLSLSQMEIFKTLMRQSKNGVVSASRLLLQAHGIIDAPGSAKVNILNLNQGGNGHDDCAGLSNEELDRQIHHLLMDTSPPDVIFSGGSVLEVQVVEEVHVKSRNLLGRDLSQIPECEPVPVAVGEAAPDGSQ